VPETRRPSAVQSDQRVRLPFHYALGPLVTVTFAAAGSKLDIAHGLGQVPTGRLIHRADGPIYDEPGVVWTKEIAYMRATNANTHAVLQFYTVRGDANEV